MRKIKYRDSGCYSLVYNVVTACFKVKTLISICSD